MTQSNKDLTLRSIFSSTLFLALVVAASAVHAQVRLENTLTKVETFVDDAGEVQRRMVSAERVVPGDELQYVVRFTNEGDQAVDAGTIVITDAIPSHTEYLEGSAFGAGTRIEFSLDGERYAGPEALVVKQDGQQSLASAADYAAIRWVFAPGLEPGASGHVSFNVRLK